MYQSITTSGRLSDILNIETVSFQLTAWNSFLFVGDCFLICKLVKMSSFSYMFYYAVKLDKKT